jgi:hypothetical protein
MPNQDYRWGIAFLPMSLLSEQQFAGAIIVEDTDAFE